MKKISKIFSIIVCVLFFSTCLLACAKDKPNDDEQNPSEDITPGGDVTPGENTNQGNKLEYKPVDAPVEEEVGEFDFARKVTLSPDTNTVKYNVKVKSYIDGDTTHFYLPNGNSLEEEFVKARYLGVNTPESTGKIEEYGKKASKFTKSKLAQATSIYIESDDENWNSDSTGSRYLLWVWYKTSADKNYRNLNIELLQEGLAIASNSANNRYGEVCMQAINYAKSQKLNVYSGQPDPDMYYGTAIETTIAEIRTHIQDYVGKKVAFNGVVTKNVSETAYLEDFDEEIGMYVGMTVYYGFGAASGVLSALDVGNLARVVGTVQYYENGGTYQVAGLEYDLMNPDSPENTQLIEANHKAAYTVTTIDTFFSKVKYNEYVEDDNGNEDVIEKEANYAELALSSSIQMDNLYVESIYTTDSDTASNGAMSMTCKVDGKTIVVRTVVLYKDKNNGILYTADDFLNKTITVKGIVDYFNGSYQIKVFSAKQIIVNE